MSELRPSGSDLTQLIGGEELDITYLDGRAAERIKVRVLPVEERHRYLETMNNEAAQVELFCAREPGWAAKLSAESYDAIADKGQELNLPLFRNWYRRLNARTEALNPGLRERIEEKAIADAAAAIAEASPSINSASPSPSAAT